MRFRSAEHTGTKDLSTSAPFVWLKVPPLVPSASTTVSPRPIGSTAGRSRANYSFT